MANGIGRRGFMGCLCCAGAGALAGGFPALPALAAPRKATELSADQALAVLKEGNASFNTDSAIRSVQGRARRLEIARAQTPFTVLVSCSDSRVPPELLFGRGLGEMFIVRNAGNTVDTAALGSIEYGVAMLGVPLVVVLGHERCGAVEAAVAVVRENAVFPGSIGRIVEPIVPAVLSAQAKGGDLLYEAMQENVRRTVMRLRTASEPILLDPLRAGLLRIVGATYDLDTGEVDFFDEG